MRISAALIALLLWFGAAFAQGGMGPGPGMVHSAGGSVAVDATGTDFLFSTGGPATGTPITIGGSANALLCVGVWTQIGNAVYPSAITMAWDSTGTNQSMTLISSTTINATDTVQSVTTAMFGLLNPTTGAGKTLSVNWSGGVFAGYLDCQSYTGANGTFATAFHNGNTATGTSTAPSVTITSGASEVAAAVFSSRGGASATFASVNNTQMFLDNTGSVGNGAGNYKAPGTASSVMSAVINASAVWVASGVSISP